MKLIRLLLALAILTLAVVPAQAVDPIAGTSSLPLVWDANTEPDLAGYRLYWGKASREYTNHVDVGNVTVYDLELPDGTWYIAATAYDRHQLESLYSNELQEEIDTIPPGPPTLKRRTLGEIRVDVNNGTITATVSTESK